MSDDDGGFGADEGHEMTCQELPSLFKSIRLEFQKYFDAQSHHYVIVDLGAFDPRYARRTAFVPVAPGTHLQGLETMNRLNYTHFKVTPEGIVVHPDQAPEGSSDFKPPMKMTLAQRILAE